MRVLFASLATVGHTYPMMPLAIALREAGHDVHFAVGEPMHPALAARGLRPFRPADVFSEIYSEDLESSLLRLAPDLVVHGWGVPGAGVAARLAGIPAIWHGFGRMFRDGIGLELPTLDRPHVDICPPSLQDQAFLARADRIEMRPVPYAEPGAGWDRRDPGPLVFVTLGTAFGTSELLRTTIAGLASIDARVVVAAGRVPVDQLGAVPGHTAVHAWVPQAALLPHVDLVVHHGGSGTALGALVVGAPQLVLPQGADQFGNAEALVNAGAAVRLLPDEVSAGTVAEHSRMLLSRGSHRDAARAIAKEIARMPSPDEVAHQLAG